MQKKLLPLAIAGALAVPGAAIADVTSSGSDITIYGKFHASYDFVDNDASNADDSDDNSAVFRNSRLGFKGDESLGSGLKAIWQIETELDTNDNQNAVQLRNTYIGLQGDSWGKIFFGKHDTPYKTATAKLDIFSDTIADYNNIIGSVNGTRMFDNRVGQIATYATPNFNGFSAQIARASIQFDEDNMLYAADPDGVVDDPTDIDEESEAWSAMAMYDQGPFFASVAYEQLSGDYDPVMRTPTGAAGTSDDEEIDAWKLGLGYAFGDSKIAFVYEDIEHDNDAQDANSREAYWAAFSHKFGANEVKLAYGKAEDSDLSGANDDDEADVWSIGIDHNFSKRTKVYAIYTDMDNDDDAMYGLNAAQNEGSYTPADGDDVSGFSVGIIHNF